MRIWASDSEVNSFKNGESFLKELSQEAIYFDVASKVFPKNKIHVLWANLQDLYFSKRFLDKFVIIKRQQDLSSNWRLALKY